MNLSTLFKEIGLNPTAFCRIHGLPQPKISDHMRWEAGNGGKPLGLKLGLKIIGLAAKHYGVKLTLSDIGRSDLDNQVLPYIHSRECNH